MSEGKGKDTDHVTTTGGGGSRERSDIKWVIFGKFIELLFTSWNREDHTIHKGQCSPVQLSTRTEHLSGKFRAKNQQQVGLGRDF